MQMGQREESAYKAIGRRSAKASSRNAQMPAFRRDRMVVKAVRGNVLDVDGGTAAIPMKLSSVPMTTACAGVRVGDVVVIDTYMHQPLAVGVLAK